VIRGRAPCTPEGILPAPVRATSDEILRMCAIILTLRRDALKYVTAASEKYHECACRSAGDRGHLQRTLAESRALPGPPRSGPAGDDPRALTTEEGRPPFILVGGLICCPPLSMRDIAISSSAAAVLPWATRPSWSDFPVRTSRACPDPR